MLDIRFDLDENFLFTTEPLLGISRDEVYAFLKENTDDFSICYAFFGVFNEGVYLLTEAEWADSESESVRFKTLAEEWREVELFILDKILGRMNLRTDDGEAPIGYYYVVKPFMEKNGFLAENEIFFH